MRNPSEPKRFLRKSLNHKIHVAGRFGATYFITICCGQKLRNQLCHQTIAIDIFKTARRYDECRTWYLHLMLLMPDHLHALIGLDGDASLSATIANFKRATAKFAGIKWQRNFFDHRLRHDESFMEKAEYIRHNPVRAGLTKIATDWRYILDRTHLDGAVR
jgi:putative transposase